MASNKKLPRGIRNNNPLNIRRTKNAKWAGMVKEQTDAAFCQFTSMVYGWRAAFMLLRKYYYAYELKTLRDIISRWAPPEDNNPTNVYIERVAEIVNADTGIIADSKLPSPDTHPYTWALIVAAMAQVETGWLLHRYSSMDDVLVGWHLTQLAR